MFVYMNKSIFYSIYSIMDNNIEEKSLYKHYYDTIREKIPSDIPSDLSSSFITNLYNYFTKLSKPNEKNI